MSIKQGDYLKQLRKNNNLSQEKLSEVLGISRQSISKWEQGLSAPDIENIKKLSAFFGVSADSIVNGEADSPKSNLPDMSMFDASRDTIITKKSDPLEQSQSTIEMPEPPVRYDKKDSKVDIDLPENEKKDSNSKKKNGKSWLYAAYPVIAVIVYCVLGTLYPPQGWYIGWTVLLTIPLFYTGISAIKNKKPVIFCYPVLVVMIFALLGLCKGAWHPAWILFLTIPIYYIITSKMGKK